MRRAWTRGARRFGVAVCLCAPILAAPLLFAQTQTNATPELKITTELVLVDVQVVQKKTGTAVESLQRGDFEVYEDGVQQRVSFLTRDELPLSVVFLFDLTDSVRPVLQPLADGALAALQHLKPEDEVAVMVYAASTRLLQGFTRDRALAAAAVEKASRMKSGEAAFFNEGVFRAAHETRSATQAHSRRVIIWLTDDVPNIPDEATRRQYGRSVPLGDLHTEQEALKEILLTGTTVCTILKRSELSDEADMQRGDDPLFLLSSRLNPPGSVHKYADETGGIVLDTGRKQISVKLAQMIDEIRARYTLGYAPTPHENDGNFHRIEVYVTPDGNGRERPFMVRATHGYYRGTDTMSGPPPTPKTQTELH
jgi:VWFA-related protein